MSEKRDWMAAGFDSVLAVIETIPEAEFRKDEVVGLIRAMRLTAVESSPPRRAMIAKAEEE